MTAERYAVVGQPVAHSRSPWIHARFAELTGQAITYERLPAPLDGFAATVRTFRDAGGRGCNVTLPFKFEAATFADDLSARAQLAGACNTLRFDGARVAGDNTDGVGLVRDIVQQAGVAIAGQRVLLVGAGGAAAGVLGPLLEQRPAGIVVTNRTRDKADALLARHADLAARCGVRLQVAPLDQPGAAFDIVVNATAASLAGGAIPVPAHVLRTGTLAYDMMYGAAAAPFLAWAQSNGAIARDGLGMLVEQAAESFFLWRGVRPPVEPVLAQLRMLLAAEGVA